jgi:hypothetical protein
MYILAREHVLIHPDVHENIHGRRHGHGQEHENKSLHRFEILILF